MTAVIESDMTSCHNSQDIIVDCIERTLSCEAPCSTVCFCASVSTSSRHQSPRITQGPSSSHGTQLSLQPAQLAVSPARQPAFNQQQQQQHPRASSETGQNSASYRRQRWTLRREAGDVQVAVSTAGERMPSGRGGSVKLVGQSAAGWLGS